MDDLFLIAKIKATEGAKGYLLIESFSDFPNRFIKLKNVFAEFFGNIKEFAVEDILYSGEKIALKFKGIDSSDDAKFLLNKNIFIDKNNSVQLDKDTYFIHDVIGSVVYKDLKILGSVEDVLVLPANDVYVVRDLNGKKILVPAVKDFIKHFDPDEKRLDLVSDCDLLYDDED